MRLGGGLSVLEICKISIFIASKTPSSLAVERYVHTMVFINLFRKGIYNYNLYYNLDSLHVEVPKFLQNWSKSLSNSKLEAFLVLAIKLRHLLSKRIWGSPPDKLITNYLAHVVVQVVQVVILCCILNL